MKINALKESLRLPVFAAPLFIISNPESVIAQCKAGIVGSFPALNARGEGELERWLDRIEYGIENFKSSLEKKDKQFKIAPFAVNQIVHSSNKRLNQDLKICANRKVPIMITSLRPPDEVVSAAHSYGGLVFHDVINIRHAEKAIDANVDGLILVASGAGGHAGILNPFAIVSEVRKIFDGPIVLAGAISKGEHILSALAMGVDFVYVGTRFIASKESTAHNNYKKMILDSNSKDIIYTDIFTGIYGNYLEPSISGAGFDLKSRPLLNKLKMAYHFALNKLFKKLNFTTLEKKGSKVWKDIWSAGQGVGSIETVTTVQDIVTNMEIEYKDALNELNKKVK